MTARDAPAEQQAPAVAEPAAEPAAAAAAAAAPEEEEPALPGSPPEASAAQAQQAEEPPATPADAPASPAPLMPGATPTGLGLSTLPPLSPTLAFQLQVGAGCPAAGLPAVANKVAAAYCPGAPRCMGLCTNTCAD